MYRVLRPIYKPTAETVKTKDGDDVRAYRVEFEDIGPAWNMDDALSRYGRRATGLSPVLEKVKSLH